MCSLEQENNGLNGRLTIKILITSDSVLVIHAAGLFEVGQTVGSICIGASQESSR